MVLPLLAQRKVNRYRPFHVPAGVEDWVSGLELDGARAFSPSGGLSHPPKILVLYGSLRARSFSRLLAYEFARVVSHLLVYMPCHFRPSHMSYYDSLLGGMSSVGCMHISSAYMSNHVYCSTASMQPYVDL